MRSLGRWERGRQQVNPPPTTIPRPSRWARAPEAAGRLPGPQHSTAPTAQPQLNKKQQKNHSRKRKARLAFQTAEDDSQSQPRGVFWKKNVLEKDTFFLNDCFSPNQVPVSCTSPSALYKRIPRPDLALAKRAPDPAMLFPRAGKRFPSRISSPATEEFRY